MNLLVQPGLGRRRSSGRAERWLHRSLFALFALMWVAVLLRQVPALNRLMTVTWIEPALLVAALLVTVSALAQRIPLQNAVLTALVVGLLGGGASWLSFVAGLELVPLEYPQATGRTPFREWFWVPAILCVVVVMNAREVALHIILQQPTRPNRGFLLIGLTTLLVVIMALMLEPFASRAHHYWLRGQTRLPITWEGVPLPTFLGWGVVAMICQIAATAALIDKHPRPAPPAIEAVWIWVMLSGLLGVGDAVSQLWGAAAVAAVNVVAGLILIAMQRRIAPDAAA